MEDAALDSIAQRAEAILQEKKKEREKARKMRMEELEKQQKEENEQLDKQYELLQKVGPTASSTRRSLQPILASRGSSVDSDSESKDLKVAYSELEEKYRRAMVGNSQLDNEKQAVAHLVDVLKDKLEDAEEKCYELQREAQDKHKRLGDAKHQNKSLASDIERLKILLTCRDELIRQYNLRVVDSESDVDAAVAPPQKASSNSGSRPVTIGIAKGTAAEESADGAPILAAVLSSDTADMLKLATPGTLDEKVRGFIMENAKLKAEIANVRKQMDEERESRRPSPRPLTAAATTAATAVSPVQTNGIGTVGTPPPGSVTDEQLLEQQRESTRQMAEYKAKVQKAESDLASLESSVMRLEVQVKRFKEMADEAEKTEDELKADKRKLQKQLKEAQLQIEELENQKQHLQNRLDKIRQARKEVLGN